MLFDPRASPLIVGQRDFGDRQAAALTKEADRLFIRNERIEFLRHLEDHGVGLSRNLCSRATRGGISPTIGKERYRLGHGRARVGAKGTDAYGLFGLFGGAARPREPPRPTTFAGLSPSPVRPD